MSNSSWFCLIIPSIFSLYNLLSKFCFSFHLINSSNLIFAYSIKSLKFSWVHPLPTRPGTNKLFEIILSYLEDASLTSLFIISTLISSLTDKSCILFNDCFISDSNFSKSDFFSIILDNLAIDSDKFWIFFSLILFWLSIFCDIWLNFSFIFEFIFFIQPRISFWKKRNSFLVVNSLFFISSYLFYNCFIWLKL